ncbi:DUF3164 family protein [Flavobacterium sp. Fl-318]|uniref:DUF3164 family protein n=1 Tax=Flavobacterium cupriresistens TaxID=2893885 RepID=A0ABU4R5W0_9FLAO|nr:MULTISPECIES: DUF3164 family protein [unclassified Flavobacterium]MDX6187964.1 DUF3164 family protein [Flavobacterium sp. Fl-318]UFH42116.1 DUF3164 family protein [Flavobacterium sp. F-323]
MSTVETQEKQYTAAELEVMLANLKKAEKAKEEREKVAYEKGRDEMILKVVTTAKALFRELGEFKQFCHIEMDNQAAKLSEYGKLRSNSKGGFSVTDSEDTMRVTRRRDTEPVWDERSTKAIELIKEFLGDAIKKRDVKMYEILMSFLERNANGDLEYGRVMDLYKHEDKFDDPRWKEGLKLIKESFSNHLKGYGYELKIKGDDGKWQNLCLNFSSL